MLHRYKKYNGVTEITIAQELNKILRKTETRPIARAALHDKEADFTAERNWYRTDQVKNRFQERIIESQNHRVVWCVGIVQFI